MPSLKLLPFSHSIRFLRAPLVDLLMLAPLVDLLVLAPVVDLLVLAPVVDLLVLAPLVDPVGTWWPDWRTGRRLLALLCSSSCGVHTSGQLVPSLLQMESVVLLAVLWVLRYIAKDGTKPSTYAYLAVEHSFDMDGALAWTKV